MVVIPILLALAVTSCEINFKSIEEALQQNDIARASSLLKSVAPECSQVSDFYALTGVTDELSGNGDAAEAAFQKAISLDPRSPRLKEQLGAAYLRNKKPGQAKAILREAIALNPTNVTAIKYLIGACVETNSWKEAAGLFNTSGEKISASSDPLVLLWFARSLIETQQLQRLDREFPPSTSTMPPALLFSLGTLFGQHGLYDKAVNYLSHIPEDTDDDAVYFNLGLAYSHLQQFDKARQNYFLAIDKHPEHADAYFRIGLDYGAAGDARRALPWLFRAHECASSRADMTYALIEQLVQLDYLDTASHILAQTATGDPLLAVAEADLKNARGDTQGARREYRAILGQRPDFSPALIGLALADVTQGNNAGAKVTLLSVLAKDPADARAQAELGKLEARQGDWSAAFPHLQSAWKQDRSSPEVALELSRVERHLDQPGEALQILTTARSWLQQSPAYHLELAQIFVQLRKPAEAQEQRNIVARLQAEAHEGLHFDSPKTYVH